MKWSPRVHLSAFSCAEPGYCHQPSAAGTPAGRLGRVDELVEAVIYLASDSADYITGQVLYLDGGWTA